MFKKLKDKLAEEVKSSPQRIQQFAQAAQAAVTSASSSISDITNSDLFSIGDNDSQQSQSSKSQSSLSSQNTFQNVSLIQPSPTPTESEYMSSHDILENQRQRRLSNSSFASDVSFRLPSYETPSMYHLQSDMEVSASEAEERGISGGTVSLDRVTKEQLYAAYRRTQERYTKYRTQYGDLARHYKLLERENAKARSVLVETQDKALRRISELREQCALEQSAKAHLEKALRIELEENNMKIEALSTKVQLLQTDSKGDIENSNLLKVAESDVQLINLSNDSEVKQTDTLSTSELSALSNKIEKMEQLLNKYKESLKTCKEKNSQITTEMQILSNEVENKNKDIDMLKSTADHLSEAKEKIQELSNINEDLQNKINVYEFNKTREQSTIQLDYLKAQEEIADLRGKIEVFSKREEEYAISLAENKLSIHKELESKENEIKSLKDSLDVSKKEIHSLNIVLDDYKNNVSLLEVEKSKLKSECNELGSNKSKILELESKIEELAKNCHSLEQSKTKADEEYKCLQLQFKQETAEKLAMIDRNLYLENKNTQLSEENSKKSTRVSNLEAELRKREKDLEIRVLENSKQDELLSELTIWKDKYSKLESEIQEERDELIKLQSEIEKLLVNHESLQSQNVEFRQVVADLKFDNTALQERLQKFNYLQTCLVQLKNSINDVRKQINLVYNDTKSLQEANKESFGSIIKEISNALNNIVQTEIDSDENKYDDLKMEIGKLEMELTNTLTKNETVSKELNLLQDENNNLIITIQALETEKILLNQNVKTVTDKFEKAVYELNTVKDLNEKINFRVNEYENKIKNLQEAVESEKFKYLAIVEKYNSIKNEKLVLEKNNQDIQVENKLVMEELDKIKNQHKTMVEQVDLLQKEKEILFPQAKDLENKIECIKTLQEDSKALTHENNTLKIQYQNKIQEMNIEYNLVSEELNKMKYKYNEIVEELDSLRKTLTHEKNTLKNQYESKIEELNIENKLVSEELDNMKHNCNDIKDELDALSKIQTHESTNLKNQYESKIQELNIENKLVSEELDKLKHNYNNIIEEIDALKKENYILLPQAKEVQSKIEYITKLQEEIKILTYENRSLKSQTDSLSNGFQNMEIEINELRQSHNEIEAEKNHLNGIIDKLESNQNKNTSNKDIESKSVSGITSGQEICANSVAFDQLTNIENATDNISKKNAIENQILQQNIEVHELSEKYSQLKLDYDLLKEENRRYKSDIEGLQTYLTKISKENSVLNDKLRESIATSDHPTENNTSTDLEELKNDVQSGKDRIDDLLRENSLLIEENLELKDQLQSQNYSKSESELLNKGDNERLVVEEKYNDLLQVNNTLEKRLVDLEHMNKSVNMNLLQMQEKNDKLRLSNEKLERRLDEALVSLRHLHSLQENTELEYLRNILYEYLTGPGIHSVTLAKVLSAIVKFDDMQTKLVLQKEKERQGLLRQLGIT